jgi:hypothetical protein
VDRVGGGRGHRVPRRGGPCISTTEGAVRSTSVLLTGGRSPCPKVARHFRPEGAIIQRWRGVRSPRGWPWTSTTPLEQCT